MDIGFGEGLLLLGLLIAAASAFSGLAHGTVLSISILSVTAGIGLALTDVVTVEATDTGVFELVELALIFTLFADGLLVERELFLRHWSPPARALTIALPITLVLLGLAAKLLFPGLSWAEAFLLGAVLAPTDPVVTSSVVSAPGVPERVRHTLNIESGLNDGLALPLVLVLLAVATVEGGSAGTEALQLLGEVGLGVVVGVAVGMLSGRLLPLLPGGGLQGRYEGVYALGVGMVAFGAADVAHGNGLIAAFVGGIALGWAEHEAPEAFETFNESVSAVFQTATFFAFGALLVSTGFQGSVPALIAFVLAALLVARPLAVLLSLAGTSLPRPQRLFIAWFGPKGVASILFALIVLESTADDRTLVFEIAAFVVLASIAAHGLTDTVGARWIERQLRG